MAMALMLGPINADAIDSGAAAAGDVLTADGSGGAAWQAPQGGGGGGLPYLVYVALLTQSGENAPVATVLQNTLGGEVVWTRAGMGEFYGTLTGAFPYGKTIASAPYPIPYPVTDEYWAKITLVWPDKIKLLIFDIGFSGIDEFGDYPIEIRVYP